MRRVLYMLLFVAAAAVFGALHGASAASAGEGALTQGLPTDGLPTDGLPTGGLGLDLEVDVSLDLSLHAGGDACCQGGATGTGTETEADVDVDAGGGTTTATPDNGTTRGSADLVADLDVDVSTAGPGTGTGSPTGQRPGFTGRITADLAVDLHGGTGCPLPEDTAGRGLELPELPELPEPPEAPDLPELPDPPGGGDGIGGVTDQLSTVCDCLAELVDGPGPDGLEAMSGAVPDPADLPAVLDSPESALVGPMVAMSQLPSPVGDVPVTLLQLQQGLAG